MLSSQKLSKIKGHGEYKIWYVLTLLSNWETYKRNGPDKTGIYQKWSRYTLNLMTPCTDYKEEAYSFWAVSSTLTLRDKTWTKKGRSKSKDRRWKPNGIGQQFPLPRGKMTFTVSLSKWLCFPCFCATGWLVMALLIWNVVYFKISVRDYIQFILFSVWTDIYFETIWKKDYIMYTFVYINWVSDF